VSGDYKSGFDYGLPTDYAPALSLSLLSIESLTESMEDPLSYEPGFSTSVGK
jgi:hypothetical protein